VSLPLNTAHEAFRREVLTFLNAELTDELREAGRRCAGIYNERPEAMTWLKILDRRGWAVPSWPVEWGGTTWSPTQHYVFERELALAGAPQISPNALRMVGPVILAFGTPAQKQAYLPRIRSGEDWWAQGYSEPQAGSDLAALQCRAVREGDDYVIDGTKIWTSHAQWSNKIFCLVRTAAGPKPQYGISFLLFDLDSPGVKIQKIASISGDHEVNQIFFDGVRVPTSSLLGVENEGWAVAKYLLQHERGASWSPQCRARLNRLRGRLTDLRASGGVPAADVEVLQRSVADFACALESLEAYELWAISRADAQVLDDTSASALKVTGSELRQRLGELELCAAGLQAAPRPGIDELSGLGLAEGPFLTMSRYLNDRSASIYAGANEVQRNIVARTILAR
jgi:acyl-CoA dehydrogenase